MNFRFRSSSHINNYKKFINDLNNDDEKFYKFIQKDLSENVKFFYKNNQTFSLDELEEIENFREGMPENIRTKVQSFATYLISYAG